jgi:hypothetical protein
MRLSVGVITSEMFKNVGCKLPKQKKKDKKTLDSEDTLIECYKYGKSKEEIQAIIKARKKVKQH